MKLTTKGRYAVTAMMDLGLNANTGRVVLTDIAERQGISLSYLEQLCASLRKAGLINAVRGPGGGYALTRSSTQISVAEILTAVDESLDLTCGGGQTCGGNTNPCMTHDLWSNLSQELYRFLSEKKLADIVQTANHEQIKPYGSEPLSDIPVEMVVSAAGQ